MHTEWIPLPFPTCPSCRRSWVRSYHRNCYFDGEISINAHLKRAKCEGCDKEWPLMNTRFYCSCNYVFSASDVSSALSTDALVRQRIVEQLAKYQDFERGIRSRSQDSFSQWVYDVANQI